MVYRRQVNFTEKQDVKLRDRRRREALVSSIGQLPDEAPCKVASGFVAAHLALARSYPVLPSFGRNNTANRARGGFRKTPVPAARGQLRGDCCSINREMLQT